MTRSTLSRRLRAVRTDDSGITMVLVVGYSVVVLVIVALLAALTITSVRSATNHGRFEAALSTAEAGVDSQLARVQAANDAAPGTGDAPVPAPGHPTCPGATVSAGATFATAEAERAWARTRLEALVAAGCAQTSGEGQYVVLKPTDRTAVYSLSAVPSFASADATQRLVKAEYLFTPYSPSHALLTGANLCFSGSVEVLRGTYPSADVHSNQNVQCPSSGNPAVTVEGTVSASGTVANTNINPRLSNQPRQSLPVIDAAAVYRAEALKPTVASSWYDLCPGGQVRSPAATGPCTGTLQATVSGSTTYQGWRYLGLAAGVPQWETKETGNQYPGVYYVHQGDALVHPQGNPFNVAAWNATVIASSGPNGRTVGTCGKVGGNIDFDGVNILNRLPGIVMLADADIDGHQRIRAEAGMLLAGDQLNLQTSSSEFIGAMAAADQCNGDGDLNQVQGVTIFYDGTVELPLASLIRTALWLEYVG
ncbi:hypothetical protein [Aquipuribacter sp. SD81]|uniref:hypothetical protein n=1 Tax=Aquipuribacter sp. SD81 TaxID=3127703 RepID=UPI00301AC12D